jgi:hypothetical protein
MFQTEPSYSQQQTSVPPNRSRSRRWKVLRVAEILVGLAFVGVLVYVAVFAVRVTKGVSRDIAKPGALVRLQILNGCGINGLAAEIGKKLNGSTVPGLDVKVVDADNFDVRRVKKSFVISRTEDISAAVLLAQHLGLDPAGVIFQPLDKNIHRVSATLVLGEDYGLLKLDAVTQKEK